MELAGPDASQLAALEALYQQLGRWDDLLRTYNQRLEGAQTPAEKTEILGAIGALHEGPFGSREFGVGARDEGGGGATGRGSRSW